MFKQDRSEQVYMGAMAGIVVVALIVGFLCAWLVMPTPKTQFQCSEWQLSGKTAKQVDEKWGYLNQITGAVEFSQVNGELIERYTSTCERHSPVIIEKPKQEIK